MRIDFEEKGHVYSVNGNIASISVTELLAKHGLAPNYKGVSKSLLKASSNEGKEVHKDLENILNESGYEPKTQQGSQFQEWVKENVDCGVGEQKLAYEYEGMIIAGTADVMGILKDGSFFVGDHKNTATFHREYVTWQVNLLDYFARKLGNEKVNGKLIRWKSAEKFYCFHYGKDRALKVYELDKIDDTEIERLLMCEYKGEMYQRPVLVIDHELQEQFEQAEQVLSAIEKAKEQAETKAKELREKLCQLFIEQGIKSWESNDKKIKVSLVEGSDQIRVDSKKLKTKYPQVFADCQKLTQTKPTVRVTLREEEGEQNGED